MRALRDIGIAVTGGCALALLALYGSDCPELALWLGFGGGVVLLLFTHLARDTRFRYSNRYRFLTWLDGKRGRHAPLEGGRRDYLTGLLLRREHYMERGLRSCVRDVDKEIRKAKRSPAHELAKALMKDEGVWPSWWRRLLDRIRR
jgi:hypothetical protein